MQTAEEVVNTALSLVGSKQFVTDLNEESIEAVVGKLHYEPSFRQVLGYRWWNFAEAEADLARLTVAGSGYAYAYALPSDVLPGKTRYIYSGAREGLTSSANRVPFAVRFIAGEGQCLLTDHESPTLFYTRQVDELVYWPESVAMALAWLLAPKLALGLSVDLRKGINFAQEYERQIAEGMAEDMNSVRRDVELQSAYARVRG